MALKPKDPAESIVVTFDFSANAISVSAPVVSVRVISGTDAAPSALLSGSPQVQGATVLQRIVGGVSGVWYELRCQADDPSGNRWVATDDLPVVTF